MTCKPHQSCWQAQLRLACFTGAGAAQAAVGAEEGTVEVPHADAKGGPAAAGAGERGGAGQPQQQGRRARKGRPGNERLGMSAFDTGQVRSMQQQTGTHQTKEIGQRRTGIKGGLGVHRGRAHRRCPGQGRNDCKGRAQAAGGGHQPAALAATAGNRGTGRFVPGRGFGQYNKPTPERRRSTA